MNVWHGCQRVALLAFLWLGAMACFGNIRDTEAGPRVGSAAVGNRDATPGPASLVFLRNDDLWIVSPSKRTAPRMLVRSADVRSPAVWDGAGTRVAWITGGDVRVLSVASLQDRRLPLPINRSRSGGSGKLNPSGTPAWDRSGDWLVVGGLITEEEDSDGGLWRLPTSKAGRPRRLLPPSGADGPSFARPKFSRDYRHLLVGSVEDPTAGIMIYNWVDKRPLPLRRLTQAFLEHVTSYEWAAESGVVLLTLDAETGEQYSTGARGPGGIWRWKPLRRGDQPAPWIERGSTILSASASPDGRRIAYLGFPQASEPWPTCELRIYDIGGKRSLSVWRGPYEDPLDKVSWSPDSRYLAVSASGGASPPVVSVIEVATGSVAAVIPAARCPSWSP